LTAVWLAVRAVLGAKPIQWREDAAEVEFRLYR